MYKNISPLTNDEIKSTNIIKDLNVKEIIKNFYKIIDSMNIDNSFKNILKNFFNIDNVLEKIPYLYYDDKTNEKYWYMPDSLNGSIFLDYDKEIPFFVSNGNFLNDFFDSREKEYIVIKKEGMESYVTKQNKKYIYKNYELPTSFVYYPNKHNLGNNSSLFYFTKNPKLSFPCFNFRILNEEKTIQLLKRTKSEKNIEDIKNNLNIFINDYTKDKKIPEIIENNPFITNYYDYNEEIAEIKNKNYLTNLFISNNELIVDEIECGDIEYFNENISSINIKYNFISSKKFNNDYEIISNSKFNTDYEILKFYKVLLPEDKIKPTTNINNLRKLIKQENYTLDKYLIINKKENVYNPKIIEFNENIEINNKSESKLKRINRDSLNQNNFLFHNKNNNLYVINTLTNEFKFLDNVNVKEINVVNEEFKNVINLEVANVKKFCDILMIKTKNKIFSIVKQDVESFLDNKKIDFKIIENEKNQDNYKINTRVLVSKETGLNFSPNMMYKKYYINDEGIINYNLLNDEKEKYVFVDFEYTFKEGFYEGFNSYFKKSKEIPEELFFLKTEYQNKVFKNVDFFKEYLIELKINGFTLDKEDAIMFFDVLEIKSVNKNTKSFFYKNNKNNIIIEVKNINEDNNKNFYLMKNKKTDIGVSCFNDKELKSDDLFYKEFIDSKIIDKRYNKYLNKYILYSKENIHFVKLLKKENHNFDYDKTLKNKDSILNNEKSLIFYNGNKVSLNLNKNKEIVSFKDATEEDKINKIIKSIDISL